MIQVLGGFKTMNELRYYSIKRIPAVGAEQFAKYIYEKLNKFVQEETKVELSVVRVEFMEHAKNTAIYE
jgi:6-pyruvoyltetrahydropterin/6-carboxytetrahydropterin synthase